MKFICLLILIQSLTLVVCAQSKPMPGEVVAKYYDSVKLKNKLQHNFIESFTEGAEWLGEMPNFDSVAQLYYQLTYKDSSNQYELARYYLAKVVRKLNMGRLGEADYYNELFYNIAIKNNFQQDQITALRRLIGVASLIHDTATFQNYFKVVYPQLENFEATIRSDSFKYNTVQSYFYFINYAGGMYAYLKDSMAIKKLYDISTNIASIINRDNYFKQSDKNMFERTYLLIKMYYKRFFPNEINEDFYEKIKSYFLEPNAAYMKADNYDAMRVYLLLAQNLKSVDMLKKSLTLYNTFVYDNNLINNDNVLLLNQGWLAYYSGDYKGAADKFWEMKVNMDSINYLLYRTNFKNERENYISNLKLKESYEKQLQAEKDKRQYQMITYILLIAIIIVAVVVYYFYKNKSHQIDKERLFLAQSIHDEIAPLILFTRQNLIRYHKNKDISEEAYNELNDQISNVRDMVRQMSHEINDKRTYSTNIFKNSLIDFKQTIERISGKAFEFEYNVPNVAISFTQYHRMRLIVSELVANTVKHAQYNKITLRVTYVEHRIIFFYQDDGTGFSENILSGGIGMKNLLYHTEILKGDLKLNNQYPNGYHYQITIPLT
jgi:signal transduction histidine kinase